MARKVFRLASPLFLFFVLFFPYSIVNRRFIVEWFGCGCPKIDELGNVVQNDFNANDFTFLFWLFITLCVTVIAFFVSKGALTGVKRWAYIAAMFIVSFLITYHFYQMLMWN